MNVGSPGIKASDVWNVVPQIKRGNIVFAGAVSHVVPAGHMLVMMMGPTAAKQVGLEAYNDTNAAWDELKTPDGGVYKGLGASPVIVPGLVSDGTNLRFTSNGACNMDYYYMEVA